MESIDDKELQMVSEPIASYSENSSYTMPRSTLLSMLSTVSVEDIPMAIKYLVDKLSMARKKEKTDSAIHVWDNYQLSAEWLLLSARIFMAIIKKKSQRY